MKSKDRSGSISAVGKNNYYGSVKGANLEWIFSRNCVHLCEESLSGNSVLASKQPGKMQSIVYTFPSSCMLMFIENQITHEELK